MKLIHEWANTVAILLIAILVLVGGNQSAPEQVGGITNYDSLTLSEDLVVTDDVTISGGSFTVTTSNSATSTAEFGCLQMYATSTATSWKLQVVASSTQMAPGYNGLMLAKYGTCPTF